MSIVDDFAADAGIKSPSTKYQVPAKGDALKEGLRKYDPTAGNNFFENALIGAGKGFYDMGAGLNQLTSSLGNAVSPSLVSNQTIAAQKQAQDQRNVLDNPINSTSGGLVGQIGANVATMAVPVGALGKVNLLAKALNPTTIRGSAALGAGMGAAQGLTRPVGTQDSRLANTATGAAVGGIGGGLTGALATPVANAATRIGLSQPVAQTAGNLIGNTSAGAIAGGTQGVLDTPLKEDGSIDWAAMGQNAITGLTTGAATGAATHAVATAGAKYAQPVVNRLTQSLGIGAKAPVAPEATPPTNAPAANDATADKPRYRINADGSIEQVPQPVQPQAPASTPNTSANAESQPGQATPAPDEAPLHPDLQKAVNDAADNVNQTALSRHKEAYSLPVPVHLSAGQATGEGDQISYEQNNRGIGKEMGPFMRQQNKDLTGNFDAIRSNAAPDVTATNDTELGQSQVDAYKAMDKADKDNNIRPAYQALKDANGGKFPVDGKAFADKALSDLADSDVEDMLPAGVRRAVEKYQNGKEMDFNRFTGMQKILGAADRAADRSGDDNVGAAIGIVRNALENLPMSPEVEANIKPLADAARAAAKARFDRIDADPAYKAVVNDDTPQGQTSPLADSFVKKYIIGGTRAGLENMKANLADNPLSAQNISAAGVNYLKTAAGGKGNNNEEWNISQKGLNSGLANIAGKHDVLFDPKSAQDLLTLGKVTNYSQFEPADSYVNHSNTLTGAIADKGIGVAAVAANGALPGAQLGTIAQNYLARRSIAKSLKEATQPGAGIKAQ